MWKCVEEMVEKFAGVIQTLQSIHSQKDFWAVPTQAQSQNISTNTPSAACKTNIDTKGKGCDIERHSYFSTLQKHEKIFYFYKI